jgi:exodeoxyribonuclease-5
MIPGTWYMVADHWRFTVQSTYDLTSGQVAAIEKVENWLSDENRKQIFRFFGYAGTGKTYAIAQVIKKTGYPINKILFMAPTNKAKMVLKHRLKKEGFPGAVVSTIHSALYSSIMDMEAAQIQSKINKIKKKYPDGIIGAEDKLIIDDLRKKYQCINNVWIKINNSDLPKEEDYEDCIYDDERSTMMQRYGGRCIEDSMPYGKTLFIVDEVSMVSFSDSKNLLAWDIPILAVGDPAQLPPIKESGRDIGGNFFIPETLTLNPDIMLDQITRQEEGDGIIVLSSTLRPSSTSEGRSLYQIKRNDYKNVTIDRDTRCVDIKTHITIVGKHKTRLAVNADVREASGFTKQWPTLPSPGEHVFCQKTRRKEIDASINGEEVKKVVNILNNGCLYAVVGYEKDLSSEKEILQYAKNHNGIVKMYLEETFVIKDDEDKIIKPIEFDFDPILFQHKFSGGYGNAERDAKYYLDFGYAITAYASQGSEFENVTIRVEYMGDKTDYKKLHYTAATRAKKSLNIVYNGGY